MAWDNNNNHLFSHVAFFFFWSLIQTGYSGDTLSMLHDVRGLSLRPWRLGSWNRLKVWLEMRTHFWEGSFTRLVSWCWMLAGGLSSSLHGSLQRVVWDFMARWLVFPEWAFWGRRCHVLYDSPLEVTPCHFCSVFGCRGQLDPYERGLHKGGNTKGQGSSGLSQRLAITAG